MSRVILGAVLVSIVAWACVNLNNNNECSDCVFEQGAMIIAEVSK